MNLIVARPGIKRGPYVRKALARFEEESYAGDEPWNGASCSRKICLEKKKGSSLRLPCAASRGVS